MLPVHQLPADSARMPDAPAHLQQQLQLANGCYQGGDFRQCISVCRKTIDRLLQTRSDETTREVLNTLPRLPAQWRLLRSEFDLTLHGPPIAVASNTKPSGGKLEVAAAGLLDYLDQLLVVMPALGIRERLAVLLRSGQRSLTYAELPLYYKRRLLVAMTGLQRVIDGDSQRTKQGCSELLHFYSVLFHEPMPYIKRHLRAQRFWNLFNFSRRLVHLENRPEAASMRAGFCWPERDAYQRMTRGDTQSRVLVTIHMGDFYGAFRVIANECDEARGVISLRREHSAENPMRHFLAHKLRHTVLHHGSYQTATIVSALRKGGQTLAILFDLREDFGETIAVEFFGLVARFVKGPAQLAIMGRARIIPFVCYEEGGGYQIDMESAIDSRLRAGESLPQGVQRVTQQLVLLAERWIRGHPAQWKYLDSLPGYFAK